MSTQSQLYGMPPILEPGGVVRFTCVEHLAKVYERELNTGRLTAIDTAGAALFTEEDHMLVVAQSTVRIPVRAQNVYRQGDIVGLQVTFSEVSQTQLTLAISSMKASDSADDVAESIMEEERRAQTSPPQDNVTTADFETGRTENQDRAVRGGEPVAPHESVARHTDPDYFGLLVETGQAGSSEMSSRESTTPTRKGPAPGAHPALSKAVPGVTTPAQSSVVRTDSVAVSTEQGSIRPIHRPQDYTEKMSVDSLFSLILRYQRATAEGRLTFLTPGGYTSFDMNARGGIVDFSVDLSGHFVSAGLVKKEILGADRFQTAHESVEWLLRVQEAGSALERRSVLECVLDVLIGELSRIAAEPGVRFVFEHFQVGGSGAHFEIPLLIYARRWLDSIINQCKGDQLDALYETKIESYPILNSDREWRATRLKLDQAERRFVEKVIPRGRSLRELLTISPLNRRKTLRLLFVLESLQMVIFQADVPEFVKAVDPADALAARLSNGREGYYEALGLHITAHPIEFDEALKQIRESYSRASDAAKHSPRSAELCKEIIQVAEAAHRFLQNRNQRVAYRKERHTNTELVGYAQLLIDKMKIAVLREESRRAMRLKEVAMELAPQLVRRELASLTQKPSPEDEGSPT